MDLKSACFLVQVSDLKRLRPILLDGHPYHFATSNCINGLRQMAHVSLNVPYQGETSCDSFSASTRTTFHCCLPASPCALHLRCRQCQPVQPVYTHRNPSRMRQT